MLFPAFSTARRKDRGVLSVVFRPFPLPPYIFFSPTDKIAIWEELGEELEKDFGKGFGSSLIKPGGQK